ncbi:CHC2 zinc finger domain-containing protein [Actinophytocola sediminis]
MRANDQGERQGRASKPTRVSSRFPAARPRRRRADLGGHARRAANPTVPTGPEPALSGPPGIVELVVEHTALRPLDGAQLRSACPFCESTAFGMRPEPLGTFHCFRCGEAGDRVRFATKITGR